MTLPTGPAVVGLERIVLPTSVGAETHAGGSRTCRVTAPTCRYGSVVFQPQIRFVLGGSILEVDGEERIGGGASAQCVLDSPYPVQRVGLWRVSLAFDGGALSRVSPEELAEVLSHPWPSIREAALLALGQ